MTPSCITIYDSKYKTLSISLKGISNSNPILDGKDFKNHICAVGDANSICPILSRLTFVCVTSTPHFSQMTPRCFSLLYFPHKHS